MDSDNILSILAALGQDPSGAPANVLQQAAPPTDPAPTPLAPPQTSIAPPQTLRDPSPIVQSANADAPPMPQAKPRRSVLDTIGRISDVLAKVGGAEALYEPTLNAREDRTLKLGDHDRQIQADNLKIATDKFALGDSENARLGQFARGLKAIQTGGGDINTALPLLAARMHLDPQQVAGLSQVIAADPRGLDGIIAATTDPKYDQSRFSGNIVYATDSTGKLHIFQPSQSNDGAREVLPQGFEPVDPLQFVNTGGTTVGVGKQSGSVKKVLPNSAKPDTVLTTKTQRDIAAGHDATSIEIAGMPARAKDGTAAGGKGATDDGNVPTLLDNIQSGFADLHRMNALPGEGSAAGRIEGAISRSALGQKAGEQIGLPSAQKRLEIMKNVSALQQAMLKSLPASATRTKFEQEMLARGLPDPSKMSYATANTVIRQLRESYATALAASKKTTPVRKPASGWSVLGVK